jgi:hypothetical protein
MKPELSKGENVSLFFMRRAWVVAAVACSVFLFGCKRSVPNDIVQKSIRGAMSTHAPNTASAMCGTKVQGLIAPTVTVKDKKSDNTGVAHVRGAPRAAMSPAICEGDVEFKYSYTSKTTGYKRKTTTTTWYLEHVKLVAVQTPGVKGATVEEDPDGDDE